MWDAAFAADRPVLIEAVVDPNVPPIPPQMKPEQVKRLAAALRKDDPERAGAIDQLEKEQPELAKQLQPAD